MYAPDSLYMTVELHLVSNMSIPVNSLSVPSTTLRLRPFGMPSLHVEQTSTNMLTPMGRGPTRDNKTCCRSLKAAGCSLLNYALHEAR